MASPSATHSTLFTAAPLEIDSPNVTYSGSDIISNYEYRTTEVQGSRVAVRSHKLTLKTQRDVPKTGLMLVGWGGNNGTTVTAGVLANRLGLSWETKEGVQKANYVGSITQASTLRIGADSLGNSVFTPLSNVVPMVNPNDLVLGGWDISSMNLADAMRRAKVLDVDLQRQLAPHMSAMRPLPSIYYPDFIAANQSERADNVLGGTTAEQLEEIRKNIRDFKAANALDKVIVLWTATTERFADVEAGLNDTAENLLASIQKSDPTMQARISPSTIFAVATILEGCAYINGSPQNTFVPGVIELAVRHNVFISGDDFKSGQTKLKSVLVDFLISAGIKPASIVSYNHLGNNDGFNLSAPQQFRSKEISKSNVVDDMVESNRILYAEGEMPDHVVVIKYVPYVGDSKRAMDEYTSEIFMGGKNTLVVHNTCEDSLLAAPLIFDLAILCELFQRIQIKREGGEFESFHAVLSPLSYLLKAPMVPEFAPVVNALGPQRQCIVNILRACVGLPAEDAMGLEFKIPSMLREIGEARSAGK